MCDPYPCWEPGISEGPAGYKGTGRTKYTFHPNVFDFHYHMPKFYRGDPPKTNRSKSNPFENFYSWDSNQEKKEDPDVDDFKFMGLKRSCSEEDLRKRYLKLAREYHPDKGGTNELFRALKDAYDSIKRMFSPVAY